MAATEHGISRIVLPGKDKSTALRELGKEASKTACDPAAAPLLAKTVKLLKQYFSGESVLFDVPVDLRYYTPFQQAVWQAAKGIPSGEKRFYGWIAKRIRRPKAARAVGQALGANPVPIIIPCHRVISSRGALGGFSGGLGMKKKLLDLEAHANIHH